MDKYIDIFAFAITLYEIVFQQKAWTARDSEPSLEERILKGDRPIVQDRETIPEPLVYLIENGWAHTPQNRYTFEDAKTRINDLIKR